MPLADLAVVDDALRKANRRLYRNKKAPETLISLKHRQKVTAKNQVQLAEPDTADHKKLEAGVTEAVIFQAVYWTTGCCRKHS